jgi:hypothetical protein
MLIFIIIIILIIILNSEKKKNISKKDKNIKKIKKKITKLNKSTKNFLKNFNLTEEFAYFKLYHYLINLENITKQQSQNYVVFTHNSYKLPDDIIKTIQEYDNNFQDLENIGLNIENEIKRFVLDIENESSLNEFLKTFEYLSKIYYPSDETIDFELCGKKYIYSKKMNNVLNFLKGEEKYSEIFYRYNQELQKCREII